MSQDTRDDDRRRVWFEATPSTSVRLSHFLSLRSWPALALPRLSLRAARAGRGIAPIASPPNVSYYKAAGAYQMMRG